MSSSLAEAAAPARSAQRPARWPWAVFGVFIIVASLAMILVSLNHEQLWEQIPYAVAFAMFGVVGALIVSRDPRNTIGILFLWSSLTTVASFFCGELFTYLVSDGWSGTGVVILGFANNFGWLLGILPTLFLLPLLFPDGHLPSPRWRPLLWLIVGFIGLLAFTLVFGQRRLTGSADITVANPLYVPAVGSLPNLDPVIGLAFPVVFGGAIVSLILRFRRSTGVERQQIKWVVFGFAISLVGIVATSFSSEDTLFSAVVGGLAFLMFPVLVGIAILRFHLYDLDVVVRKAVVYAALAVFATAVYLGLVVGLGTWLGRGDSFLTMVAAVLVAIFFQPARTRLTRFANRLVYGKRATPYEVLAEFSERVGDAYADEDVLARMARVLGEGIGAERADVWLAVDDELRDVAAWPAGVNVPPALLLRDGVVPDVDGADRVFPVERAGALLGALAVRKPANEPFTPADEKLIADLAGQAGLVLRNVRLTEDLKARLDDLKATQKRLVFAQDEGRRRLERNIHDGAQQQLVALAVKTRLARQLTDRDPAKAADILVQIEAETHQTLEDLRDLARGIYPPLLADKGLEAAIGSQAGRSPVPVVVHAALGERFDRDVEAAVYFSVLEALQNVAKYADARQVEVSLTRSDGELTFEVVDDGRGFDPSAVGYGTGLQGIADRLGALDGSLQVSSVPGAGARLLGRLPVDAHDRGGA